MNSHIYRAKFMDLTTAAHFTARERTITVMLFPVLKNKQRILDHLPKIPGFSSTASYTKIRTLISDRIVQYPSQLRGTSNKFAAVHVPASFPSHDLLFWAFLVPMSQLTFDNMMDRVTACQLKLDEAMQCRAKQGYDKYWAMTFNPQEKPMDRDGYYKNRQSDAFLLLNPDNSAVTKVGYHNRKDIDSWLNTVRTFRNSNPVTKNNTTQ